MNPNETGQDSAPVEEPLKDICFGVRGEIERLKAVVKGLKEHGCFKDENKVGEDRSEMKANIMLVYRHLEDARMRLGKVVQAYDGGTSVYPK